MTTYVLHQAALGMALVGALLLLASGAYYWSIEPHNDIFGTVLPDRWRALIEACYRTALWVGFGLVLAGVSLQIWATWGPYS